MSFGLLDKLGVLSDFGTDGLGSLVGGLRFALELKLTLAAFFMPVMCD